MADIAHVDALDTGSSAHYNSVVDVANEFTNNGDRLITSTTLSVATASFQFTSIPQTYTHLRLVWVLRSDVGSALDTAELTFNGDTGANYQHQHVNASAGTLTGTRITAAKFIRLDISGNTATAGLAGAGTALIPLYTSTVFQKHALIQLSYADNNTNVNSRSVHGIWHNASIAAITSIKIDIGTGTNFVASSYVGLYGVH